MKTILKMHSINKLIHKIQKEDGQSKIPLGTMKISSN